MRAERDALLAELGVVRQHENIANDQLSQFENQNKIKHVHNASIVSHALDFEAMLNSSVALNNINNMFPDDLSDLERGNQDRRQIIQWHLSEISRAKEQVDEALRQKASQQDAVDRLEAVLKEKN